MFEELVPSILPMLKKHMWPSASAHCVCVVVLCVSLCQCSFMCVRHSIFYVRVTCCDLDDTIKLSERAREKARCNSNGLSYVPSKIKEEIKSVTSGCGSFVVPYFQPATSIDRLHTNIRLGICWYCWPFRLIYQIKELSLIHIWRCRRWP